MKEYFGITSVDSAGFLYFDLLVDKWFNVGDTFYTRGHRSTVLNCEKFANHSKAVQAMLKSYAANKKHNLLIDPNFITRSDRTRN